MSAVRLERALRRLLTDETFRKEFRRDPEGALEPYGLASQEIQALKDGDERALARLGVDIEHLQRGVKPSSWLAGLLMRAAPAPLAILLAFSIGTPAHAAPSGRWAVRARIRLNARWDDTGLGKALDRQRTLHEEGTVGFPLPLELIRDDHQGD